MSIIQSGGDKISRLSRGLQNLSKKQKIVVILLIVAIFSAIVLSPEKSVEDDSVNETREVFLINVAESSTESTPLEVTGSVRSESEAILRTERQGEVTGVYAKVGQFVGAGTVLAELRNNSERAAVLQAEALLEAAKANLAKGTGGVRNEDLTVLEISFDNASNNYSSALTSTRNTLRSAYASVDDAVLGSVDGLFSNPDGINPVFNLTTSEFSVVNRLKQSRVLLQAVLVRQSESSVSINSNEDLLAEIDLTEDEVRLVRNLLDDALIAINNAIPAPAVTEATIAGFKTSVTAARLSINGTLTALSAARDNLNNSKAALNIAEQNLERGTTGAQAEDVSALQAAVKQAEAGLSLANANLARTLIITPISGTLNTLNLRSGDFASAFELAAIVSNNNALEVETYLTESDKEQVKVGSTAVVSGRYEGVVTSVSPGLDPDTKKIEVRIGIVSPKTSLTHGSSVRVEIERNGFEILDSEIEQISIPISALKVETSRVIVFTVEDSTLVANEVIPGIILGDNVVVNEGLTPEMNIVVDARGLREGQQVIVTK